MQRIHRRIESARTVFALGRSVVAAAALVALLASPAAAEPPPQVTVYRSPDCGCCGAWVKHLEKAGFSVEMHHVSDVNPIKRAHGVPPQLASCHTALVGGYVVEGHVPAADVKRLLAEQPKISGLAVPGMPIGSPGMEGPNPESYDVLTFDSGARFEVFTHHEP